MSEKIGREIVVVADYRNGRAEIDSESDDLDQYTADDFDLILETLKSTCQNVRHYRSPREFIAQIHHHQKSLVLPLWSGRASRNRTALLAAVSEAAGLECFGADTYTYIVCQDKWLSKALAVDAGLKTPASVLVREERNINNLKLLDPPLVVKPIFEGSSIGISQKNLCLDHQEAIHVCRELLVRFNQPILVEKFIDGIEATVTIWGNTGRIFLFDALEIYDATGKFDFSKTLWSLELKTAFARPKKGERPLVINEEDKQHLTQLFQNMGQVQLARIDGRIDRAGHFIFLESNPEPDLTPGGSVATSFRMNGIDYAQMFYQLLKSFDC